MVYRSYTLDNTNLLHHTQLSCTKVSTTAQPHFIFPFASNLLQSPFKASGHANLCNLANVYLYIEFHDKTITSSSDEYEVIVNCTKIQKLSYNQGRINVKI